MIELALAPGISLTAGEPGTLTAVHMTYGSATIRDLDDGVAAGLLCLSGGPATYKALTTAAASACATARLDRLDDELRRLARGRQLRFHCTSSGSLVMSARLTSELAQCSVSFDADVEIDRFRLSRFGVTRRHDDEMVLESPIAFARVTLHDAVAAHLVYHLAKPASLDELRDAMPDQARPELADMIRLLVGVGLVGPVDEAGLHAEDRDVHLRQRELPDVWLHAASRSGLTDQLTGATYRHARVLAPAPAIKPPSTTTPTPLPRPDLDALMRDDPPLAAVMERRRTVRQFGERPLGIEELGEFLYRVARVRDVFGTGRGGRSSYETSDRPYPAGGETYDLEIYVTVVQCTQLRSGFYHYDPVAHALSLVNDDKRWVVGMVREALLSARQIKRPQAIITMASRFTRVSWVYQAIAYATTLKHVGVLYTSMYLAATAMGLGPCALGRGNSAIFAKLTGLDPAVESSVGEFLLGTLPDD